MKKEIQKIIFNTKKKEFEEEIWEEGEE